MLPDVSPRASGFGWRFSLRSVAVPVYRLHDTTGDDLGLIEHPAPNLEPGDGKHATVNPFLA